MNDPYSVLGGVERRHRRSDKGGLPRSCEKISSDNYAGNPLSDLAQEKMKEINEAYDAIISERRSASSGKAGASYGNYSYSGGSDFADVRNLIMSGRLDEAQTLLDGVPVDKRTAEWYFSQRLGAPQTRLV